MILDLILESLRNIHSDSGIVSLSWSRILVSKPLLAAKKTLRKHNLENILKGVSHDAVDKSMATLRMVDEKPHPLFTGFHSTKGL